MGRALILAERRLMNIGEEGVFWFIYCSWATCLIKDLIRIISFEGLKNIIFRPIWPHLKYDPNHICCHIHLGCSRLSLRPDRGADLLLEVILHSYTPVDWNEANSACLRKCPFVYRIPSPPNLSPFYLFSPTFMFSRNQADDEPVSCDSWNVRQRDMQEDVLILSGPAGWSKEVVCLA